MRILLLILALPLYSFAQNEPTERLNFKARIISDSGRIKGYYVSHSDSSISLSSKKNHAFNDPTINIPVNTIQKLNIKNRETTWGAIAGVTVLGFTLAAGLSNHGGDIDNDGKTSFWELIFSAIEGTTSSNRRRRNTAFIVGGAGGTMVLLAEVFTRKNFSLRFPLNNRNGFFKEKKIELYKYGNF